MHAWLALQRTICPRCGTAEDDWIDPKTSRYLDRPKWEAVPFRCYGCAEVARTERDIPEREAGVRVVLIPMREEDEDLDG